MIGKRDSEEHKRICEQFSYTAGYVIRTTTMKNLPVEEKRIIKCLNYLKMLIKKSEEDGTHNILPHKALVQGEWL